MPFEDATQKAGFNIDTHYQGKSPDVQAKDTFYISEQIPNNCNPPDWPSKPQQLEKPSFWSKLAIVWAVLFSCMPLSSLVLGGIAMYLHKRPVVGSNLEIRTEQVIRLGPTIFPILFAALVGRTFKNIARLTAERGAKLGNLELLVASQSIWGTIESQYLLRKLSIVSILWAMSPLGGQASLRLLSRGEDPIFSRVAIKYLASAPLNIDITMWQTSITQESV